MCVIELLVVRFVSDVHFNGEASCGEENLLVGAGELGLVTDLIVEVLVPNAEYVVNGHALLRQLVVAAGVVVLVEIAGVLELPQEGLGSHRLLSLDSLRFVLR
jgi:hypothetical protein